MSEIRNEQNAKEFITDRKWQFAKTMPKIPHEYTIRDWHKDEEAFESFSQFIRDHGEVKPSGKYNHTYLEIDGWNYWTMGFPIGETTVINRQRVEDW